MNTEMEKEVMKLKKDWKWLYRFWWALHYFLGLLGVVAAAIGAISSTGDVIITTQFQSVVIGLIATVTVSIITFLGPIQKAEKYFLSYHLLAQAHYELKVGVILDAEFATKKSYARSLLCSNYSTQGIPDIPEEST